MDEQPLAPLPPGPPDYPGALIKGSSSPTSPSAWRSSPSYGALDPSTPRASGSFSTGSALGLLALYARYDLNAVIAVANPIEHLHAASATPDAQLPTTSVVTLGGKFILGLGKVLAAHTFLLPTHRPTLLIEWLAIYAAWIFGDVGEQPAAWRRRSALGGFAIDASFTLRGTGR